MFKIVAYKRLTIFLCFGLFMCLASVSLAQDEAKPFVRLATYWDAPGEVKTISADDLWIVIYDLDSNTSRLVEVSTGTVLVTSAGNTSIRFSPSGRFTSINTGEKESTQIFDLSAKKMVAEVPGVVVYFSSDESLVMVSKSDQSDEKYVTTVVDTKSGIVKLQVRGDGNTFSPDSRLIAINDLSQLTTRLVEVASGKTVFDFPIRDYKDGDISNTNTRFSPDGSLVSIFQSNNLTAYVIDTRTWQVLYNVDGFVTFSPDSRFLKSRGGDGRAAGIRLFEAHTGKQLDKVYGEMWFSDDGKLLYRMDSTNCAYQGYMQVIDLTMMKTLVDIQKCVGLKAVNNNIIEVYDEDITAPQMHQFIDITTGKVIWQVEAWFTEMINVEQHLVLVTNHGWQTIENFVTGDKFIPDGGVTLSNSHQLAFVSNGLFVDVYGAPDLRADTMPVARVGGGIVQAPEGKINVYPMPNAATPIIEEDINPFNFYVMGKSADEQWLYATYTIYGSEIVRKQGWIANDNHLSVIEDWHDVPVLSGDDPLGDLRAVSH
ncbi:MAG: WD40 repeat domain-containing protein [Anaerolineae bacterium]|nr:WD40 repeat domain-containing protein [Anaerolineae bacterium]